MLVARLKENKRYTSPLDYQLHAHVLELVDTLDLGSSAERCAGSSPVMGTKA